MSILVTFLAIIAILNGTILLGLVSPASAYRSLSLERDIGENYLVFSDGAFENTTVYYGVCGRATEQTEKECIVRRVQANFSGGYPKEDECNIALRSESGGFIRRDEIKIDTLGKDRAIVRWYETPGHFGEKYNHLRFTIVDFSNCKVKTTELSKDLNQLIKKEHSPWNKGTNWQFSGYLYDDFNKPVYLKGEDDFEVVSFDLMDVKKTTVDSEGVASKVDTWLPYPTEPGYEPLILSLSKDKGYLLFEIPPRNWPENHTLTVALIQPNGQRQNLTHIECTFAPLVSLANGLIGICAPQNFTMMKCTQFKLGDEEINWFSVSIILDSSGQKRAIYNLPEGEGFLTHFSNNFGQTDVFIGDKYLLKIGLDGKTKQFLDPDMRCKNEPVEAGFNKIFLDDQGNYCVSTTCVRVLYPNYDFESSYVKLHTKCFEPDDFKNVSKYEIISDEFLNKLVLE
ncbi:uncharacterized protein LOC106657465 [Trichogramma pretiosum]|uniref:uncharacterized protein LOC106657465 n=1 Tax=Trichogramma pretiosum TaxID=7493 RepID=UPI0006C9881E|nr:uncharacterized protein LOC106657465 [Trichogramma pretiosum]